jgi:hypothetical protein
VQEEENQHVHEVLVVLEGKQVQHHDWCCRWWRVHRIRECRSREVISPHIQDAIIMEWQYGWSSRCLWCGWRSLWCRRVWCKWLLRPGDPRCISECILLPEDIPRDHPGSSLMFKEFPTLVVITIANECAKPCVRPMLGFLPLILLQVHIGQAAPYTKVSNIWLATIPEFKR